ncbi:MAG: hypothetical protein IKA64_02685 [Clostridia bacterium]|nr:hypothetical protein [Clostridia bacterium]
MKKYEISVEKIKMTVFTLDCQDMIDNKVSGAGLLSHPLLSRCEFFGYGIFIYPSAECDIGALGAYRTEDATLPLSHVTTLVGVGAFLERVRHRPLDEMTVEIANLHAELQFLDTVDGRVALNLPKCKLLSTYTAELASGLSFSLADTYVYSSVRLARATEPSRLLWRTALSLRILKGRPDAASVALFCPERLEFVSVSPVPFDFSAAAALGVYLFGTGRVAYTDTVRLTSGAHSVTVGRVGIGGIALIFDAARLGA